MPGPARPRLRPVESVVVPDREHGRVLVLRDTEGIAHGVARIPPDLVPIVARFDGALTCAEIAKAASDETGASYSTALVEKIASELEQGLFLDGAPFRAARAEVAAAFAASKVRAASHAGGAYYADATKLAAYLNESCLGAASGTKKRAPKGKTISALVAPHIDPWRGAVSYGHGYGTLAESLSLDADTFVLFGTSHAPMRQPFALCAKAFATPLGAMDPDLEALEEIASCARFDPYADQLFHKREHSLEFQVVFLKHVLASQKNRKNTPKIVPILAGLGEHQVRGTSPETDPVVASFLDGVQGLAEKRGERVVFVAGADLAHVGPRFGDAKPYDDRERATLEERDRESLEHATARDASAFWDHVSSDNDTRRVCGLAPIYAVLRSLPKSKGAAETIFYEQTVDPDEGSIVSHASVAFYR